MVIELRIESIAEVYGNGQRLKVNQQQSKNDGCGDPVVDVSPIAGDEYQKWVSIKNLKHGVNMIDLKPRKHVELSTKLVLTDEEKAQIDELQAQIDAIKENARKRQPAKAKKLDDMSIEELEAYLAARRAN